MTIKNAFKINDCVIQPCDFSVQFDTGLKRTIQPKQMDVLCYLAQQYPNIITRQELIDNVWNGNQNVGEKSLTNTIWHLRQELQESETDSVIIETIRRAGYRLLVEPKWLNTQTYQTTNTPYMNLKKRFFQFHGTRLLMGISSIVLILLLGFYFTQTTKQPSLTIIEHLTKQPGSELNVAPSPSGRFIVYQWINSTGKVNLYMHDRQNAQLSPTQLTHSDAKEGFSIWSPDEQYLYFSRQMSSAPNCQIIRLTVTTRHETPVANCSSKTGYQYIDLSPDGNTLAFIGNSKNTDSSGIYFTHLNDLEKASTRFSCANSCGYKDRDMAFSPDGKKIAVSRRYSEYEEDIYLVDIESKEAEQLTFGESDIEGLTWHPDGDYLVYAAQQADKHRGYVFNVRTRQKKPLRIDGFSYPSYSRKSAELFYQHISENYHIASLDLSETSTKSTFPFMLSEFSHSYPDYSLKANKIVYVSNESGHYELWLSDSNGLNREQLTHLQQRLRYPRWSNNGEKVAFLAQAEGKDGYEIQIIDIQTKRLTILPTSFESHGRPTWSYQDDGIISAVSRENRTELYLFALAGGEPTRLTFNRGRFGYMVSESSIIYVSRNGRLWQKEINNESKAIRILRRRQFNTRHSWVYHDNGIYFRQSINNQRKFMHYDLVQDTFTELARIPMFQGYSGLSLNSVSGQLLFTNNSSPQSDIKKLEHPLLPPNKL